MKNSSHANLTLNPALRVTAFFAFLGFLTLASCGEKQESMADIMGEQTEVFKSMAAVLIEAEQGGDLSEAAEKLTSLGEDLKQLKIRLSELDYSYDQVNEGGIADREDFAHASVAFETAKEKLFMSGKMTPEIDKALAAHHNLDPMPGEGITE